MKRLTLAYLDRIAKKGGSDRTWEDELYEWVECGNALTVRQEINSMSKKECLIVMDWAATYKDNMELVWQVRSVYKKIYDIAKNSLMERL